LVHDGVAPWQRREKTAVDPSGGKS
jgi:hypothetical protein